jgi:hypothetical protein
MSLRTGGGVTTSYSGNDEAALVLGPEGSRRRRGYEFVAPRRPEPRAVELLELALVGGVVPLELVNDSNDEVPLPPALAKVGDTLSEVECGVSRDARAPAHCSLDWNDALRDPLVQRRHAHPDDFRGLALAHRLIQIATQTVDDRLELLPHLSPSARRPL